uniref:Ovule protein n=1 Tax=Rodentolepis nana TaxID=102285 RepID=A0A0R3T7E3_RODNA
LLNKLKSLFRVSQKRVKFQRLDRKRRRTFRLGLLVSSSRYQFRNAVSFSVPVAVDSACAFSKWHLSR